MQKRFWILIGVLLLVINIAIATVTFSKAEYQRRCNNLINKAASYTTISSSDRAFLQQNITETLNDFEQLMKDPNVPDEIKRNALNNLNASLSSMERELNNPNISTSQKIAGIKATLQAMKTGSVDQQYIATTNNNFSPAHKSTSCPVGQNLEGMCVYALPSYGVSLDVAKSRCSNYGMSVATRDQANKLYKYSEVIYKGYSGESGSIFTDGTVSGHNSYGSYYTVLCVK